MSNKLASVVLSIATTVSLVGAPLLPVAHAQSTSDLQAQIAALLAQINALQSQLGTQGGAMTGTSYTFTRDLTVGSRGADVTALQNILISKGFLKVAATGYFGALTKAAVSAWQSSAGISPAAGYVGPKSRAALNAMAGTGTPNPNPGSGTPVPGSGLSISLASDNPAAGSLISSASAAAARVPVLAINLTAGSASGITVNTLTFSKNGVLSDSSISGAYLVENGKVVAQYTSLNAGKIVFSNLGWSIAAGQTRKLWLAIDPASGLSAGNTVGFAFLSASDVSAVDANNAVVTAAGTFPLNGNTFTITSVTNPSLGSVTVASSSVTTSVTAGTTGNLIGAWNITAANNKQWLKGINFKVIGSANKADIRNVTLKVNGTTVGSPLASVNPDGSAYFDLSANPATLNTGSNNVQVFADITGSPSYNFQFEILNSYDIYAVDSVYNVPVTAQSNVGTQVTILTGSITVTQATDTPTGNIAKGQTGVTLAKFNIYAAGEPVKVKWLGFTLTFAGIASTSSDGHVKNVNITDDAGGQVGTTINSLETTVTCDSSQVKLSASSAGLATNCFGSSTSPINYIVPANTTRVLSLRGDIQSTASFTTVTGSLVAGSSNLQGLTSSQTASSGSVNGAALTLAASSLTVAKNSGVGTQTFTPSSANRKIGSYAFSASTAEGVKVTTVSVTTAAVSYLQNMRVMVGNTQLGTTQNTVASGGVYSFSSGTGFNVAAGQTVIVDVFADITSAASAGTTTPITSVSGVSGTGLVSLTSVSLSSTVQGQGVTIGGQATVTVALDAGSAATAYANQLVMGSTGNELARFRFTETSNVEDVQVKNLNIFQQVASTTTKSAFNNLKLYKSTDLATPVATAGAANTTVSTSTPGVGYYYKFNFLSPVIVTKGGGSSVVLVLKGDISTYDENQATDNTTHVFRIASSTDTDNDTFSGETVDAIGASSLATSSVVLATGSAAPTGNTQTILRSKLNLTVAGPGTNVGAKGTNEALGTLTFSSDAIGAVALNTLTITFSGTAPSISTFLDGVTLYLSGGQTNASSIATIATSTACNGSNSCTKSWNFGAANAGLQMSSTPYTFVLKADTTLTQAAVANIAQYLNASIAAATSVTYSDALDSSASTGLNLVNINFPRTIVNLTYPTGS